MLQLTRVLCPIDFSACSQAALPIACSLARDHSATVVLLHVRPPLESIVGEFGSLPPEPPEPVELVKEKMQRSLPLNFTGSVLFEVTDGDVPTEILKAATEENCSLIVLGTHGRRGLSRLLVGSVAEAVLRKASCPVLTVKAALPESDVVVAARKRDKSQPDRDADDLVTVCTLANLVEAEIIQNALQAEQIPSFLEGAQQAGITGTQAVPIKIQVRADDASRARKFIKRHEARRRVTSRLSS